MLIGLCGYARCGKDTAADGLEGRFGRWSFAPPLKEASDQAVANLLIDAGMWDKVPVIFDVCMLKEFEEAIRTNRGSATEFVRGVRPGYKATLRPIYVAIGAGMRALFPDFWIRRLDAQMHVFGYPTNAMITDVRYLNEVKYILDHGGKVIMIKRPGLKPANSEERRSFKEINDAVKKKQVAITVIKNDSTIEELHRRVNQAIENI